jgi:hypoxanthine phosphoribosyltransferase
MESSDHILINGLAFKPFIDREELYIKCKEIASLLNTRYSEKSPVVIVLMNGAFMFASDILKLINFQPMVHFVKLSSYQDMASTGNVEIENIDKLNLKGQSILIIEDIIDTGRTMDAFLRLLKSYEPDDIAIATLLLKPNKLNFDIKPDYIGFEIGDNFVVGYGLDYNDVGRNYPDIYTQDL